MKWNSSTRCWWKQIYVLLPCHYCDRQSTVNCTICSFSNHRRIVIEIIVTLNTPLMSCINSRSASNSVRMRGGGGREPEGLSTVVLHVGINITTHERMFRESSHIAVCRLIWHTDAGNNVSIYPLHGTWIIDTFKINFRYDGGEKLCFADVVANSTFPFYAHFPLCRIRLLVVPCLSLCKHFGRTVWMGYESIRYCGMSLKFKLLSILFLDLTTNYTSHESANIFEK